MYINIYIYIYIHLSLSLSIYIYIYVHICAPVGEKQGSGLEIDNVRQTQPRKARRTVDGSRSVFEKAICHHIRIHIYIYIYVDTHVFICI